MVKKVKKSNEPEYVINQKYFGSDDLNTVCIEFRYDEIVLIKNDKEYEFHPKNFIQMAKKLNRYQEIAKKVSHKQKFIFLNNNNDLVKKMMKEVMDIQKKFYYNGSSDFKLNDQLFNIPYYKLLKNTILPLDDSQTKSILFNQKLKESDLLEFTQNINNLWIKYPEYKDQKILKFIYAYFFSGKLK